MKSWDDYFIEMAGLIATKSKDPSTQVGCVIVGPDHEIRSTGFNGFPRGVAEMEFGEFHQPAHFEKNLLSRELVVTCRCERLITIPLTDLKDSMTQQQLEDSVLKHKHFRLPEWQLSKRWERPAKYEWVEHAERNAVYNAARTGISLKGCTAYLNWEPHPCVECTKAFIQAGIIEVVGPDIPFPNASGKDWKFEVSKTMMNEAKVKYCTIKQRKE